MAEADQGEIEEAAGRELGRLGVQGTIALTGKSIELRAGGGAPVSIDIELIVNQWPLLPEEMRRRKAAEIARRLVDASRLSRRVEPRREVEVDFGSRGKVAGAVLGFFALLALVGVARYFVPRLTAGDAPQPTVPTESDDARGARLARACDAVRDRIYQGTSFGPFALEGFAVELWLAGKGGAPLRDSAAVTGLVGDGKLLPLADEALARVIDGTVEIADGFDADAAGRSPGWSAVILRFSGGYARAFFTEEHRPRFLGLADRVAAASGASHGALYARCAHRKTHDVGAWFHGPDLPGASAAIVYQMGLFSEAKMIDRTALAAIKVPAGAGEIAALQKAAADVAPALQTIVGTAGGGITGGRATTVIFALAGPVRAIGATRELSRKMGIGVPSSE